MRDGSTRRPSTSSRSRTWTSDRVQVQHWRERHRHAVLQELADGSQGVAWTRRLLNVLLEELHVTDEFDQLVGPTSRLPASQYPRLVVIALLLRHSWCPQDLARTATRLGLSRPTLLTPESRTTPRDGGHRRRAAARTPLPEPRTR